MKKYRNYIIAALIIAVVCITICFLPINASRLIPLVEKQVANDLGIKIHIEKLILRLGPSLKVKAPIMHMMYEDGQKFGQFDNVRIFLPWSALFKDEIAIKKLYANNLIIKFNSNDKYLPPLINEFKSKEFRQNPDITLKKYNISYRNSENNKIYKIAGDNLALTKLVTADNFKISADGKFYINDKPYISYDLSILPNINISDCFTNPLDINYYIEQLETLDFHSDLIADLKISQDKNGVNQISGLINIDNMSVLDKDKKYPKSFIYLTFFGNKIGILSNIYATNDKKVYAEGMLKNSKKPEIDLKIKTDEIELEEIYNKLKLLFDLSNLKIVESVKGHLAADFSIKGDLKKIKSSGYLKISDGSLKASGLNINKISSDIDFSNNVINISNAEGYVDNAPLLIKGKISNKLDLELLMSKVGLKQICPKSFGIEKGILSLNAKITGDFDNIQHKETVQIEDLKLNNNGNSLSFSSLKFDTNKENTAFVNNIQIKPVKSEVIKLPSMKLYISADSIKIPDTNVFMPNSKMKLKADVTNYNSNDANFNVYIDGFIHSKDVYALKSHSATYPVILKINGNKDVQNIEAQAQMENAIFLDEPAIINLISKIDNNSMKIEDLSVIPFNNKLSANLKSNIKGQKKLVISGIIEDLKNPTLKNIRIFIPQLLNISFSDTIAQLKGDIFVNGNPKQPEIVGQISVQNLINQFLQLSANGITVDFDKTCAIVNAPNIKLADSSLSVNSTILNDFSKELTVKNINIKSKYFNTDTILMYKDNQLIKSVPISIESGKFFADRALVSVYNSPLNMTALNADFTLKNNILSAKNVMSEMLNGKLAGNIDFNLNDDSFVSKFQARGVSAAPIFDIAAVKKDTISGTMDFDIDLNGNIINRQSLNGGIKFVVHNGRMGTLGKLEHLLYAQNVIADNMLRTSLSVVTKAITLKDTGLFKSLKGDIKMVDGVANINMLQSQGPQMALFIKGQYYPITDYAKLVVLGRLSDEVVTGLGSFGDFSLNKLMIMLTGEDNKLNIKTEDMEKLPQLPMRNTKEFRSVINGILEKPSSVIQFNWISYSQKSLRQKEVPMENSKLPEFIESLPY